MANKNIPTWLSHKPVVAVDYEHQDATAGDAKFLSIGRATWNNEAFSAKVWRWASEGERWSRQSEELPLWRVLDLATLLVATINGKESSLSEFVKDEKDLEDLKDFLQDNMAILGPKLADLQRLLEPSKESSDSSKEPNIFSFATSELSQDAMFAWLIKWADPKYESADSEMHRVAKDFLRMLLGKDASYEIRCVDVDRQWENIDVWAEVNDDTFLVIEDKTNTSIHDDQLQRYRASVEKEYKGKRSDLCYAYVKTGNEPLSILKKIEKLGYRTISRADILKCLNTYSGNNPLLLYYREHLQKEEDDTMKYRTLPEKKWGWSAWEGFYKELERRLNINSWAYVSNPAGGFLGAWWYFTDITDGSMYLQFEQGKLCFKINYEGDRNRSDVRNEQHLKLMKLARERFPEIHRPDRFGAGLYMTIAVVDEKDIFGEGPVDFDALTVKLKTYQSLIDECCGS
jgi:hypothetical protein